MFKNKILAAMAVLVSFCMAFACQKVVHGYLSDNIYYQVNPFIVQQGVTTVSSSLILNGSTAPLHVTLKSLRDSAGNNADSILRKPQTITTYTTALTSDDTTLALLKGKLKDSLVRPFNIAEIGGRLQFTAATLYVPAGKYTMDLSVSNVNGERDLKNACTIVITPLTNTYETGYFSYRPNDPVSNTQLFRTESDPFYSSFDINFQPASDFTRIVLKFVDKNGKPFNPKNGEVSDWSNVPKATTSFPKLSYWAPFYPAQQTDSTIVQQIPGILGLNFPYFGLGNYPAGGQCRIDNKITGLVSNQVIHTVMYFKLLTIGTYYITYHLNQDTHK